MSWENESWEYNQHMAAKRRVCMAGLRRMTDPMHAANRLIPVAVLHKRAVPKTDAGCAHHETWKRKIRAYDPRSSESSECCVGHNCCIEIQLYSTKIKKTRSRVTL